MTGRFVTVSLCLGVLTLSIQAQVPTQVQNAPDDVNFFEQQIRPILTQHCYQCHSTESKRLRGGLLLDSRPGWQKGGDSGPVLLPGKPEESLLIKAVRYSDDTMQMPPKGKLSDREIQALVEWVRRGAPDPRDVAKPPRKERVIDIAQGKLHWAFQPLRLSEIPSVNSPWPRNAIDRFLFAKIQAEGMQPTPSASRARLLRRATLDLVGLPPTPGEVADFVNDRSPDAWEKVVDRLLASPHFGERWGRHWLDLARFAESHGFEHDYDRPNAYHFRDFVIRALNADMPYNQFIQWQLAGDELAPDNPEAMLATGFLAAGVHSTQITKSQVEKERYDELDDKLATTGTAMLGLTLGCARCHDHKYDPIPTADYYRLLATFTTTVRSDYDVSLDPVGDRESKAAYERQHAPMLQALDTYERLEHPAKAADWLRRWVTGQQHVAWVGVSPSSSQSMGGATLTSQEDGSILVSGKIPEKETYTLLLETRLQGLKALRLDALADSSLVKGGPGRAPNGNFALSDLQVAARPLLGKGKWRPVSLRNPRATFSQKNLPVEAVLDADRRTGWAIDPQFGQNHAAVFEFAEPVGYYGGTELSVTLRFENNRQHSLGRFRLALSTLKQAELHDPVMWPAVAEVLHHYCATNHLTADQRDLFLRWHRHLDKQWLALHQVVQEHARKVPQPKKIKALICSEGVPAVRLHTQGGDYLEETHFLHRGDPNQKRGIAHQGFLQVLMRTTQQEGSWQLPPPSGARTSHRRAALARWITDTEKGAGHLLARVIVNRLWYHHFGRGLVATPSDFGMQGAKPSHPELLDWLAKELIRQGWRLKAIHKLILISAAYQQDSHVPEAVLQRDPQNLLFARWQPRRLEAEIIRDCILASSGTLDRTMFGPGTLDEQHRRRSIYFMVKRSKLIPMLLVFDAPDALQGLGLRSATTVAPQALLLMNHPAMRKAARELAGKIARSEAIPAAEAVQNAYLATLSRTPSEKELAEALAFVQAQTHVYREISRNQPQRQALTDFCQVLLSLNEFIYIE